MQNKYVKKRIESGQSQFNAWIERDLHVQIKKQAKKQCVTIEKLINTILRDYINKTTDTWC